MRVVNPAQSSSNNTNGLRQRITRELRLGQHRFTGLLDQLHLAILLEDENRQVSFVNQAFLDLFNIGLSATEFASIPCEVSAAAAKEAFVEPELFLQSVEARLAEKRAVKGELFSLKDGRWLERHYYPIFIDSDYVGMCGFTPT